jgi:4-amino-4-deoxy-L-arabinose transferase-like glycosyltransferase
MKHLIAKNLAIWLLLGIIALAAFLRFWHIDQFPPGLFGDEAVNGLDALDVLAGRGAIFFPANFGREGAHIWLVAASMRLFGVTPFAARLPSLLAGILAVAAAAWLSHEVASARRRARPQASVWPLEAWLPLLVAAYTATSYWHLHFSRFGIRGIFTTLWTGLAFAAFWRGVNTGRIRWFLLSGLCLGAGVHFYTASRFTPFVLVAFLLAQAALSWLGRDKARRPAPLLRTFGRPLLLAALVAALVVAPLGLYFWTHPGSFASRAGAVSAFNVEIGGASPLARMVQAALANMAQFFVPGQGDPAAFYNLPGRAVFDPLTALLALFGLLICLRHWRQPIFLFLALWPPLALTPTFLAVDRFPTLPRALGVMPGIFIWAALGLEAIVAWLAARGRQRLAVAVVVVALAVHGGLAVRDYFSVWGPSAAAFEAFDGHETNSAVWLAGHPQPAPVYLSADLYRHPVIMFLLEQTPLTEFFTHRNPGLHWFDARDALVLPPPDVTATYVFSGQAQAPPAVLDAWVPQRQVIYASRAPDGQPATTVLRAAPVVKPTPLAASVAFSNGLLLNGAAVTPAPTTGASVAVTLTWQIAARPVDASGGYNLRVALLAGERPWAGVEAPFPYRPAEWAAGERIVTWRSLTLPPDAPARGYQLAVALVDEAGQIVPLANGAAEVRLPIAP